MVEIKLEGFSELEEQLHRLSRATGKNTLRRALKKAAAPMIAKAQENVPVRSGVLKESITLSAKLNRRQAAQHRKMFQDDRASVELFLGPSKALGARGRHGHLVEFGTSRTAPQPFMRPAWDGDKEAMLQRLSDDLWTEVTKAIARAERRAARRAGR